MKKIDSIYKIDISFPLQKRGDLLFFEGPILSHFYDENGNDYLLFWVDKNEKYNRWLTVMVNYADMLSYLNADRSLRQIFEHKELFYIVDIDNHVQVKQIYVQTINNLNPDYLPKEQSVFNQKYAPEYAKYLTGELQNSISRSYKTKISAQKISSRYKNIDQVDFGNTTFKFNNDIMVLASTIEPVSILTEIYNEDKIFRHLYFKSQKALIDTTVRTAYFYELNNAIDRIRGHENVIQNERFIVKVHNFTRDMTSNNPGLHKRYANWYNNTFLNEEFDEHNFADMGNME